MPLIIAGTLKPILLSLTATLLMLLAPVKSLKLLASLNSKSLRKLPLINLVERIPTPILPLSIVTLLKLSSGFFNAIDIKRQNL